MNWLIALVEMDSLLNLLMVNTYVSNYWHQWTAESKPYKTYREILHFLLKRLIL